MVSFPYLLAWRTAGSEYVFGGFLFNPIDGYSYLAKMRQGWDGAWRFVLPFSAQPGSGAYIYLFYILLGHIARLTSLSLQLTFHLARLVSALFMIWSLRRFIQRVLPGAGSRGIALLLVAFGSGMGWLGLVGGLFTSDLWVSEAYPFLSAYNNPHFSLSLGLMVWMVTPLVQPDTLSKQARDRQNWYSGWGFGLAALILAELSPFGSVLAFLVCAVLAAWDFVERRTGAFSSEWLLRAVWIGLGCSPILLYTWTAVQADPILAEWNAQNLTPSPAWWDVMIALSPALPVAILGAWQAVKYRSREARPAVIWGLLALVLVYLPFGLQRRFLIGIFIPLAILAVMAVQQWQRKSKAGLLVLPVLVVLSLPSNLVVLLAGWQGISSRDARIFLSAEEIDALRWIETNTENNALIIAGPESGLFIPGWTGRRVIYGHPFETVDSQAEKMLVEEYYSGEMSPQESWKMLQQREIDYIYRGPREQSISLARVLPPMEHLELVYVNPTIMIYRVIQEHSQVVESAGSP